MSVENAKAQLDQESGEGATGFVTPSDIKASYDELEAAWQGDDAAARLEGGAAASTVIADPANQRVGRYDIEDDASSVSTWPDRLQFRVETAPNSGVFTRTGGFNGYGEGRFSPAKTTTQAVVAYGHEDGSSGTIFGVQGKRSTANDLFTVSASAVTSSVPFTAPNFTGAITLPVGASVPAGLPVGTLIIRYTP